MYVADTNNNRVQKFNSSGTYQSTLGTGSAGSGNTQFDNPEGVTVDSSGNIYVADANNDRVQKFNSAGTYQSTFATGTEGSGNTQLNYPFGVAVDSNGNVYVGDANNHRVQKFNSSGTYLQTFGTTGSSGSSNSQFTNPHGVVVGSNGNVYVADKGNDRVQIFDSSGTYLQTIGTGSAGSGNTQFDNLHGVDIDSSYNVYVADSSNHRVQKFNASDVKPTNVQDNSIFVETDTTRRYWFDGSTWTMEPTFRDYFSVDNYSSHNTDWGVSNGTLNGRVTDNSHGAWKNYGELSDTAWVVRFKYELTAYSGFSGNGSQVIVVMTDTDGGTDPVSNSQKAIGFWITNQADCKFNFIVQTSGNLTSHNDTFSTDPEHAPRTYYIEMKRTSATSATITMFNNSDYTGVYGTKTVTISSSLTGLKYFMLAGWNNSSSNNTTLAIDDLEIYNGVTSI